MDAPQKVACAIARKVFAAVAEVLRQLDVAKRLLDMGSVEAMGGALAETAPFMGNERERWGNLIRVIGATADGHELRRAPTEVERMKQYS